jgi:hypothetical protein
MRWLFISAVMLSAWLADGQSAMSSPTISGVSIPAELRTDVRADRVRRGDTVELRSVEPVLLGNGIVMPANAKLSGRIVGAAPLQGDKPSWLVLLIEKAEWKGQSVALHAFISRQIKVGETTANSSQNSDAASSNTPLRRTIRMNGRVSVENGADMSTTPMPQDAGSTQPATQPRPLLAKDVRIVTDSDGIVYLFSARENVHLPTGVLLVVQNQSSTKAAPSATAEAQKKFTAGNK